MIYICLPGCFITATIFSKNMTQHTVTRVHRVTRPVMGIKKIYFGIFYFWFSQGFFLFCSNPWLGNGQAVIQNLVPSMHNLMVAGMVPVRVGPVIISIFVVVLGNKIIICDYPRLPQEPDSLCGASYYVYSNVFILYLYT